MRKEDAFIQCVREVFSLLPLSPNETRTAYTFELHFGLKPAYRLNQHIVTRMRTVIKGSGSHEDLVLAPTTRTISGGIGHAQHSSKKLPTTKHVERHKQEFQARYVSYLPWTKAPTCSAPDPSRWKGAKLEDNAPFRTSGSTKRHKLSKAITKQLDTFDARPRSTK